MMEDCDAARRGLVASVQRLRGPPFAMSDSSQFLFMTCQVGAEPTLKRELAKYRPSFRFAYSRPGFLTYKLPEKHGLKDDFELHSVFARAYGFSLGKAEVAAAVANEAAPSPPAPLPEEARGELAAQVWKLAEGRTFDALHVWPRDQRAPGEHGYEVGPTEESRAVERLLRETAPEAQAALRTKKPTQKGDLVLDVVVTEPHQWWVGYHKATSLVSRKPGGMFEEIELPYEAVSRAYLKTEEALRWSKLPLKKGDEAVEIGCAPGGSCQALLKRGLFVTGIDPAEMHPAVFDHPQFRHLRMRGNDVKRREFRDVRWLTTDMNVAPNYTLDTVEDIVTHRDVDIEGMLLTLKLLDWKQADEIPQYISRVQSWGFDQVQCRQLQHNRREFCLAAHKSAAAHEHEDAEAAEERAARKLAQLKKAKSKE